VLTNSELGEAHGAKQANALRVEISPVDFARRPKRTVRISQKSLVHSNLIQNFSLPHRKPRAFGARLGPGYVEDDVKIRLSVSYMEKLEH